MKRRHVVLLSLLAPIAALADTQIWSVKVLWVDRTHGAVTNVKLKFLDEDNPWSGCGTLEVRSRLAPEPPFRAQTWSRDAGSREVYLPALAALRDAAATRRTISFGEVGAGLKAAGKCVVESNGLSFSSDGGAVTVLSYHDPI